MVIAFMQIEKFEQKDYYLFTLKSQIDAPKKVKKLE